MLIFLLMVFFYMLSYRTYWYLYVLIIVLAHRFNLFFPLSCDIQIIVLLPLILNKTSAGFVFYSLMS